MNAVQKYEVSKNFFSVFKMFFLSLLCLQMVFI